MSNKEVDKHHVIRKILEGRMTWAQGAEQLKLSERHVGRLCAKVRREGARGVVHGLRGKAGNRQANLELLGMAMSVVHDPLWEGFRPLFASEKLEEYCGLKVGRETLRKAMIATGAWRSKQRGTRHLAWRERRARVGLLVQMDGSDHAWFEGRGPKCVLLLMIDDATSKIQYAYFADAEDTVGIMRLVKRYIELFGRPVALYVDKSSIYRINREASVDEDLRSEQASTQFARAMKELNIEVIWAHSPQAKGRVERSFETHQDRLVKELRLAGIGEMASANEFLQKVYIPGHNARYAVAPGEKLDGHRPLLKGHLLDQIFSKRVERIVRNDFTVQYNRRFLQILASKPNRVRPKTKVFVETRLDGTIHLLAKGRYLPFKSLENRPYRPYYEAFPTKADATGQKRKKPAKKPGSKRWLFYGKGRKTSKADSRVQERAFPTTAYV